MMHYLLKFLAISLQIPLNLSIFQHYSQLIHKLSIQNWLKSNKPTTDTGKSTLFVYQTNDSLVLKKNIFGQDQYLYLKVNSNVSIDVEESSKAPLDFIDVPESTAEGVFGIFKLPNGYFLALIQESVAVDNIFMPNIREIKDIKLLPIHGYSNTFYDGVGSTQKEAMTLISQTLSRHQFYYSTGSYDFTRTVQSNYQSKQFKRDIAALFDCHIDHQYCDDRFFWNKNLVNVLVQNNIRNEWIIPVINAWLSQEKLFHSNGKDYFLCLISRRSRYRQGPRYIKRGIDYYGHVANVVETEQVFYSSDNSVIASFVQLRGSIPLFWVQPDTWHLRPSIQPARNLVIQAQAVKSHVIDLITQYIPLNQMNSISNSAGHSNNITIINLIDKKGSQGLLGKWLYASLQLVSRGNVNTFLEQNERKEKANLLTKGKVLLSTQDEASIALQKLYHYHDVLPSRIECDSSLNNRSKISVTAFKMPLNNFDINVVQSSQSKWNNQRLLKSSAMEKLSVLLNYVWFDYHKQCKGGKVDMLQALFPYVNNSLHGSNGYFLRYNSEENLSNGFTKFKYFYGRENINQVKYQQNIIRTNCVDCLDRTNVVQTLIGRWALLHQIQELGIFTELDLNSMKLPSEESEKKFRRLWGDNGDYMSLLYAGTRALKRDVTRLGKRTSQGALDDGVNSAMRYYINNYEDMKRQKGIDMILGNVDGNGVQIAQYYDARESALYSSMDTARSQADENISEIPKQKNAVSLNTQEIRMDKSIGGNRKNQKLANAIKDLKELIFSKLENIVIIDDWNLKIDIVLSDVQESINKNISSRKQQNSK